MGVRNGRLGPPMMPHWSAWSQSSAWCGEGHRFVVLAALVSPEARTGLYSGDCSVRSVWEVQTFSVTYSVSMTQTQAVTSSVWRCSEKSARAPAEPVVLSCRQAGSEAPLEWARRCSGREISNQQTSWACVCPTSPWRFLPPLCWAAAQSVPLCI